MAGLTRFILALAALASVVTSSCVPKSRFDWDETKYLLAFGDSYTFVLGTAGRANYSFIGDNLPGNFSFTPEKLLTDSIVQNFTSTAEGGPNWVEYLTGCGVKPGLTRPQACDIQLWDFAYAGADVAEQWLPLHWNHTIMLVNQTQQWLTWAEPVVGKKFDKRKALVAIWIGINDINDSVKLYPNGTSTLTLPELWEKIISTIFSASVEPLYDAGYNNFLFMNLPPLDRTKANQASTNPRPSKAEVNTWNAKLAKHASLFEEEHDGAKSIVYDANTFLNGVLDNPAPYGITNTTSFCPAYNQLEVLTDPAKFGCQPLDEYFWYNSGHMTSHAHEVMVPDIVKTLKAESAKGPKGHHR